MAAEDETLARRSPTPRFAQFSHLLSEISSAGDGGAVRTYLAIAAESSPAGPRRMPAALIAAAALPNDALRPYGRRAKHRGPAGLATLCDLLGHQLAHLSSARECEGRSESELLATRRTVAEGLQATVRSLAPSAASTCRSSRSRRPAGRRFRLSARTIDLAPPPPPRPPRPKAMNQTITQQSLRAKRANPVLSSHCSAARKSFLCCAGWPRRLRLLARPPVIRSTGQKSTAMPFFSQSP